MRTLAASLRAARPHDCEPKLNALLDAGFEKVLLAEPLHRPTWEALLPALPREHALAMRLFLPYPRGVRLDRAAPFVLGETHPEARRAALRQAFSTLEAADSLGVRIVVLPVVEIETPGLPKGLVDPARPQELPPELLSRRRPEAADRLDSYLWTLARLLERAERYGLALCVTPTNRACELPLFEETDRVLREFRGAPLRVWLDTARWPAEALAPPADAAGGAPGLAAPWDVAGASLHDARAEAEKLPPGDGDLDWNALAGPLRRLDNWCLDLSATASRAQLASGREFLLELDTDGHPEEPAASLLFPW
jgi:sugar phosphate isomerase/epimerase